MFNFERIGVLIRWLPDALLDSVEDADWHGLREFLEYLIHHFIEMDKHLVWDATQHIAALKSIIEKLLVQVEGGFEIPPSE